MPVFPNGVPRYSIHAPTTLADDGRASPSILNDVHRIFALVEDERWMTAFSLYKDVKLRLDEWGKRKPSPRKQQETLSSPTSKLIMKLTFSPRKECEEKSKEMGEMENAKKHLQMRCDDIQKLEVG